VDARPATSTTAVVPDRLASRAKMVQQLRLPSLEPLGADRFGVGASNGAGGGSGGPVQKVAAASRTGQ